MPRDGIEPPPPAFSGRCGTFPFVFVTLRIVSSDIHFVLVEQKWTRKSSYIDSIMNPSISYGLIKSAKRSGDEREVVKFPVSRLIRPLAAKLPDGRLLYRLKRRWRNGTTEV